MHSCKDKSCRFKTQHAKAMAQHQAMTLHGQARKVQQYTTISGPKGAMMVKVKHKGPQHKKKAKA